MTTEFKFELKSSVLVLTAGRQGKVIGNYIDRDQIKYAFVEYADANGAIFSQYFREEDLSVC